MISLTDKAIAEVKRIISEQELAEGSLLRVGVSGGGCSGMSYVMGFEEQPRPEDTVVEFDGLRVAVAADAEPYLDETIIDFNDGVTKRGFVFDNPNATGSCGCGSSFSV